MSNNAKYLSDEYRSSIAVIGMAGQYPGASNLNEFWQQIRSGAESVTPLTDSILLRSGVPKELIQNHAYVKSRGVLADIEKFDAEFFNISPFEASIMDPQHRLFIEKCWEALEVAGYSSDSHQAVVGLIASVADNTYLTHHLMKNKKLSSGDFDYQLSVASSAHFLATKAAYLLDLKGPSLTVSTGCSSSLVAIIMACKLLLSHDCDIALAGGVSLKIPQIRGYLYREGGIFASDGHCRPFDASSTGTVSGAGVGVVVLKRLQDALADNDTVDAIIRDYNINNDGSAKVGYTAPSVIEQARCIATALSSIDPETVEYIEAHGTGTYLGDPIEVAALTKAYRHYTNKKNYCSLGSVKANIGHADAAAGVAGFQKVATMLKKAEIPPLANFRSFNKQCDFENSPFYISRECQAWAEKTHPRRAGVSSFGIGGTNTHMVLEESVIKPQTSQSRSSTLLVYSAHKSLSLEKQRNNLISHLQTNCKCEFDIANAAYTLAIGRKHLSHRETILLSESEQADLLAGNAMDGLTFKSRLCSESRKKTVFMFPGQGTFQWGALTDLYSNEPCAKRVIDQYLEKIQDIVFREKLFNTLLSSNKAALNISHELLQPALFFVEYILAQLLIEWGVCPDAVVGHSLGEFAAMCVSKVLSFEQSIEVLRIRGRLSDQMNSGGMVAVKLCYAELVKFTSHANLAIAAVNSPSQCVVSGASEDLEKFKREIENHYNDNSLIHVLNMNRAFHSNHVDTIREEFLSSIADLKLNSPRIPVVSTLTGSWLCESDLSEQYFAKQLRGPVQFSKSLVCLLNAKFNSYIEIGPSCLLQGLLGQHAITEPIVSLSVSSYSAEKKQPQLTVVSLQQVLANCWVNGLPVNWVAYYHFEKRSRVPLPTYPFDRKRYWVEPDLSSSCYNRVSEFGLNVFTEYWSLEALHTSKHLCDHQEVWLVFDDIESKFFNSLASVCGSNVTLVLVKFGQCFSVENTHSYSLNLTDIQDYQELINTLRVHDDLPDRIFYGWSLSASISLDSHFVALSLIAKCFYKIHTVPLSIITSEVARLNQKEQLNVNSSCLFAFAKVIAQEYVLELKLVDITPKSLQQGNIDLLISELLAAANDDVVAIRENYRFVRKFKFHPLAMDSLEKSAFKMEGTFIITGGLGRMGLALAEYLARTSQAHLILISRKRDAALTEKLELIEQLSSSLKIYYMDISVYTETVTLLKFLKKNYSAIDGIFHCAGVLKKIFSSDMSCEDVAAVTAAKTRGTENLSIIVEAYKPDFCILSSSIATVLGGVGMSLYAAANAYMDAYVQSKSDIETRWVSVRWDAITYNNSLDAVKIDEGINLLRTLLQLPHNNCVVTTEVDLDARVKRSGLADKLQRNSECQIESKMTLENKLLNLFKECLGLSKVGEEDDFFQCGGDSLLAIQFISSLELKYSIKLNLSDFVNLRTVKKLCVLINSSKVGASTNNNVIPLSVKATNTNLFLIHPLGGSILCYLELARHLEDFFSCYAMQDAGLDGDQQHYDSLESMAKQYLLQIKQVQPVGPYHLVGYSFGGTLAFEMAQQLLTLGESVEFIALIDSWAVFSDELKDYPRFIEARARIKDDLESSGVVKNKRDLLLDIQWQRMQLLFDYTLSPVKTNLVLAKARELLPEYVAIDDPANHWAKYASSTFKRVCIDGDHDNILSNPGVGQIADILIECLQDCHANTYSEVENEG